MALQNLIDKEDNFEIIRDRTAQLLTDEIANQMALAVTAGQDPQNWNLKVMTERSNPFEQYLNDTGTVTKQLPLVNIWYDNTGFDGKASNIHHCQKGTATYNIDIYGAAPACDDGGTGHIPGDEQASREVQRATRLVRNILMASENVNLGFPAALVWKRWIATITSFQPQLNSNTVQQVVGMRIAFHVDFSEESPQYEGQPLCELGITLKRAEDGTIIAQSEYDFT